MRRFIVVFGIGVLVFASVVWAKTTMSDLNGVVMVEGDLYPRTSAGLQAAVNDCAASCHVHLSAGVYDLTGTTTLPSDLVLSGEGDATKLVANSSVGSAANLLTNADHANGNTGIVIRDLAIDGNQANRVAGLFNDDSGNNILFKNCYDCRVERVTSLHATGQGISFTGGTASSTVAWSTVGGSRRHNVLIAGVLGGNTTGNLVHQNRVFGALAFVGIEIASSTRNLVSQNHSYANAEGGAHAYSHAHENQFINNYFYDNGQNGVSIVDESNGNLVAGNHIYNNKQVGIASTVSQLTKGGSNNEVKDNIITGNGWNAIRGNYSSSTIEGNELRNNGFLGTGSQRHGTYIATTNNLKFLNNTLEGNADRGAYFIDIADYTLEGNHSYKHVVNYYIDSAGIGGQRGRVVNNESGWDTQNGFVFIKDFDNNILQGNSVFFGAGDAYNLRGATNNLIQLNVGMNNVGDCIELRADSVSVLSTGNIVRNNLCTGNAIQVNESGGSNNLIGQFKGMAESVNFDLFVASSTRGVIFQRPDGTCARQTVDNSNNHVFTTVTCP